MRVFSVDLACAGVQRRAHKSQILHRAGEWKVSEILYVYGLKKKEEEEQEQTTLHLKSEFPSHASCFSYMKLGPGESRENMLTHIQVCSRLTYTVISLSFV